MEPPPTDTSSTRLDSSGPTVSCESIQSMDEPLTFNQKCGSIQSMDEPLTFNQKCGSIQSMDRPFVFKPSCETIQSMDEPLTFEGGPPDTESKVPMNQPPDMESIFKHLQENIFMFEMNELKRFQTILNFEEKPKGDDENEEDDEGQSIRAAFLKITVHFLRTMKQETLADCLENRGPAKVCQYHLKSHLKKKSRCVFEGIPQLGNQILLNQIFTELHITQGVWGEVNDQHEIKQIEMAFWKPHCPERMIRCHDIFQAAAERDGGTRVVMTMGMAGIGKTVLTQKFTLDWAEGKANQDIEFIFPFAFKELNLLKEKPYSLVELVHLFFIETKEAGICKFDTFQVVFVFDGLDECRLPLDFENTEILNDITVSTSVETLLVNLIRGKLLPSARIWITTRPAAACQIPPDYVDVVTEVRGFTDAQKEEYFEKRFKDEEKRSSIISHIKSSQNLNIMCHIPVFCWITATVLEQMFRTSEEGELPKTITEMYIRFLVVQSNLRRMKYDEGAQVTHPWKKRTRKTIKSLAKLAFEQLQKGNLIFYESDLTECGLDIRAASVYSGVLTQIFKEERGLFEDRLFSFIHLSVQEFLAALHVHETFTTSGVNLMSTSFLPLQLQKQTLKQLYRSAVNKASQNQNGHLDLFLRFFLGLTLPKNQNLLRGLLSPTKTNLNISKEVIEYIKQKISENQSQERSINLFYCLNELNDHTLEEEIQQFLRSGHLSTKKLSPVQWSALVFTLLSSGKDLDEFDLKKYFSSEDVLLRLLPVIKASTKAQLSGCNLSETSCSALSSILSSQFSSLKILDMSHNKLEDSGVRFLSEGLKSPHCSLETLRLHHTMLTKNCCKELSSVLSYQPSSLENLDLSWNKLQNSGMALLSDGLMSPQCALMTLRLTDCELTEESCNALSSVIRSPSSKLIDLELSQNELQDSGASLLFDGLMSSDCVLKTLRLSKTKLSKTCCASLSAVLKSQSSSLRNLDLSQNDLLDSGVKLLSTGLQTPNCKLETLCLAGCMVSYEGCASLANALTSNPAHLRELDLSFNHPGDDGKEKLFAALNNPHCRLETLRLDHCGEERLKPALRKYASVLTVDKNTVHIKLKLSNNNCTMVSVTKNQNYPHHPERFNEWPQLLCSNSLTSCHYWEVEWGGRVNIAVAYKGLARKGEIDESWLGRNNQSWSLICSDVDGFCVWHDRKRQQCPSPSSKSHKVAVYLDCPGGTLSYYCISSKAKLIHLHTFKATFTEPLYPGFGFAFDWPGSTVTLCSGS